MLARLLAHPDASTFEITAIVRTEDKAKKLAAFGVKGVVGSFKTDLDLVEKQSEAAHVVFHCVSGRGVVVYANALIQVQADADDPPSVKAVLAGLKSRHEKTGDLPIYIHTVRLTRSWHTTHITDASLQSGTGVLTIGVETKGEAFSDNIYDDANADQINALPDEAFHRNVDLAVVQADKDGKCRRSL